MTIDTAEIAQRTIWTKAELDEALNTLTANDKAHLFDFMLNLCGTAGASPVHMAQWIVNAFPLGPLALKSIDEGTEAGA